MGQFDGKVVFVTGAGRGQGQSHAVRFAKEGADVIAVDICEPIATVPYPLSSEEDLAETVNLVEKTRRRIVAQKADVRDHDALAKALADGVAELGRLDFVLANAGIAPMYAKDQSPDSWRDAIDVMLTGPWNTIDVAIPHLLQNPQGGVIVLTGSTASQKAPTTFNAASPGFAGYTAAKHGVIGLTKFYANALAEKNIRVNAVSPAAVATMLLNNEACGEWFGANPEMGPKYANLLPVPQVEARDVTNAMVWLCSEAARYVTGVQLPVDAGYLAS
jgi:SDR family mycofactocin-dependent oxidoreductase